MDGAAGAVDMKISAIAPWFGAKRNLSAQIIAELGPHRGYWEIFCGSMAILLAKPPSSNETVNDLHGDLINLARVVQDHAAGPALYRQLRRVMLHEQTFRDAAERYHERGRHPAADEPDLTRAIDYFICSWFGRNGVAGTASYNQGFCRRFTNNGGHAATRWESAVESIPAWRRRFRHVTILNTDAFELAEKIEDEPGMVVYADPPYLTKGADYIHDFADDDHHRLAGLLSRFQRARVIVSYYDDPRLDGLYPGWTKRRLIANKSLALQNKRGAGRVDAPEVLLINGPSLVEHDGLFAPQRPWGGKETNK